MPRRAVKCEIWSEWLPKGLVLDPDALERIYGCLHDENEGASYEKFVDKIRNEEAPWNRYLEWCLTEWLAGKGEGVNGVVTRSRLAERALSRLLTRRDMIKIFHPSVKDQVLSDDYECDVAFWSHYPSTESDSTVSIKPLDRTHVIPILTSVMNVDDEETRCRVRTILNSRAADDLKDNSFGIHADSTITELIRPEYYGLVCAASPREKLMRFRHQHPFYQNISLDQSKKELEAYLDDVVRFAGNFPSDQEWRLDSRDVASEALKEYTTIKKWLESCQGRGIFIQAPASLQESPYNSSQIAYSQTTPTNRKRLLENTTPGAGSADRERAVKRLKPTAPSVASPSPENEHVRAIAGPSDPARRVIKRPVQRLESMDLEEVTRRAEALDPAQMASQASDHATSATKTEEDGDHNSESDGEDEEKDGSEEDDDGSSSEEEVEERPTSKPGTPPASNSENLASQNPSIQPTSAADNRTTNQTITRSEQPSKPDNHEVEIPESIRAEDTGDSGEEQSSEEEEEDEESESEPESEDGVNDEEKEEAGPAKSAIPNPTVAQTAQGVPEIEPKPSALSKPNGPGDAAPSVSPGEEAESESDGSEAESDTESEAGSETESEAEPDTASQAAPPTSSTVMPQPQNNDQPVSAHPSHSSKSLHVAPTTQEVMVSSTSQNKPSSESDESGESASESGSSDESEAEEEPTKPKVDVAETLRLLAASRASQNAKTASQISAIAEPVKPEPESEIKKEAESSSDEESDGSGEDASSESEDESGESSPVSAASYSWNQSRATSAGPITEAGSKSAPQSLATDSSKEVTVEVVVEQKVVKEDTKPKASETSQSKPASLPIKNEHNTRSTSVITEDSKPTKAAAPKKPATRGRPAARRGK